MSLSCKGTNILFGRGFHLPFFSESSPFSLVFATNLGIGAVISRLPVGIFFPLTTFTSPLLEVKRFICVPRKTALSARALVMRVFSSERSSLRSFRSNRMFSLRHTAVVRGPHTPIIQSSAYLTYLKPTKLGFGIIDLFLLL